MIRKVAERLFLMIAVSLLTLSCDYFPERVDAVVFNFVTLDTDSEGHFCRLRDDYGKTLTISGSTDDSETFTPDSTYRMICSYVEYDDNSAELRSTNEIISCIARPLSYFDGHEIKKDPMGIQSYWVSGGYLNIVLEIKGLDKAHSLCPIDYSSSSEVKFGFYHDQNSDVMSYTKNAYVSIPLWPYTFLNQGDTIKFSVMDYDGEEKTYSVRYK